MSEAKYEDPSHYSSFNAFFTRELKDGLRSFSEDTNELGHAVDGTVSQCGPIEGEQIFQAKGHPHERGSLTNPNATMNRVNSLINIMKKETINGKKLIDIPVYRDKLMTLQAKVMAFQSNSLRVLSAKLNPGQDVKMAGMIQKYYGTELRHELEGFAVDVMGEIGTLYESSPHLRDKGSWQFLYMYYLGPQRCVELCIAQIAAVSA